MPTTETITAAKYVILFKADRQSFHNLLREFPEVETHLWRGMRSRHFIRNHPFAWLNDDELVYQISRKHIAHLILTLVLPMLMFLVGSAISLFLALELAGASYLPCLAFFSLLLMERRFQKARRLGQCKSIGV